MDGRVTFKFADRGPRSAIKGVVIRECYEPHLRANKDLPTPYPCIKHDMRPDACAFCKELYKAQNSIGNGGTYEGEKAGDKGGAWVV